MFLKKKKYYFSNYACWDYMRIEIENNILLNILFIYYIINDFEVNSLTIFQIFKLKRSSIIHEVLESVKAPSTLITDIFFYNH